MRGKMFLMPLFFILIKFSPQTYYEKLGHIPGSLVFTGLFTLVKKGIYESSNVVAFGASFCLSSKKCDKSGVRRIFGSVGFYHSRRQRSFWRGFLFSAFASG
jgi:hypothetical protein